ncbi:hypothetical protein BAE44_0025352, partial [Dichanthelium oligosanthes]
LPPQSAQSEDEALRTTAVESSNCEHHKGGRTKQRLLIRRPWQQRPSYLKPIHCSIICDKHAGETIANVVTSLPFIFLGLQFPRNSLVGVGLALNLYHSSKAETRKFLRWADDTMIATTTLCLSRALRNENPRLLMAASAFLLPFQPLMVSAVHTGMMENNLFGNQSIPKCQVSFARRVSIEPEPRMAHNVHRMSSLLGGALFIDDDCFPETPYMATSMLHGT